MDLCTGKTCLLYQEPLYEPFTLFIDNIEYFTILKRFVFLASGLKISNLQQFIRVQVYYGKYDWNYILSLCFILIL